MKGPSDPNDALINALGAQIDGGGIVTAFVVIAEYVDADGDVCLWADSMRDQRSNRSMGLLEWGLTVERARVTQTFLEDD